MLTGNVIFKSPSTGMEYKGEMKGNKKHGEGVMEWGDGEKCEGKINKLFRLGQNTSR